jgi:hypothetical protein
MGRRVGEADQKAKYCLDGEVFDVMMVICCQLGRDEVKTMCSIQNPNGHKLAKFVALKCQSRQQYSKVVWLFIPLMFGRRGILMFMVKK